MYAKETGGYYRKYEGVITTANLRYVADYLFIVYQYLFLGSKIY